jgi:S-adenosylmethionine synthetase
LSPSLLRSGTSKKSDEELVDVIRQNFDLRPGAIGAFPSPYPSSTSEPRLTSTSFAFVSTVKELDLQKPQYQVTSSYGHFGNPNYTWEKAKKLHF